MKKKLYLIGVLLLFAFALSTSSAFAATYVATIDGTSYTSLQTAVNKVKSGQTITVTSDITTNSTVTISAKGKEFTINMAGNKYTYTGNNSAFTISAGTVSFRGMKIASNNYAISVKKGAVLTLVNGSCSGYIKNNGTLTIKNGSYNTKGAKESDSDELVQNAGNLTIDNGTFTATTDNCVWSTGGKVVINSGTFKGTASLTSNDTWYPTVFNHPGSTMIINGGVFTAIVPTLCNRGKKLTINGGSFCSTSSGYPTVLNLSKMEINDGKFNNKKPGWAVYNSDGQLVINDGSFLNCIGNEVKGNNYCRINGGTFRSPSEYVNVRNFGGNLQIYNGDFYCKKSNCVSNMKGHVTIYDGYFKSTNGYYALWNESKATLKGGTFITTGGSGKDICNTAGSTITVSSNVDGQVEYRTN